MKDTKGPKSQDTVQYSFTVAYRSDKTTWRVHTARDDQAGWRIQLQLGRGKVGMKNGPSPPWSIFRMMSCRRCLTDWTCPNYCCCSRSRKISIRMWVYEYTPNMSVGLLTWKIIRLGLPAYLARHPQYHLTLSIPTRSWSSLELIKHNHYINMSLRKRRWHALQVGQTWSQAVIPTLHLTPDSLILGVGGKLVIHPLNIRDQRAGRSVGRFQEYPVANRYAGSKADIVGIHALSDGQLAIAQYDGTLQRVSIPDLINRQQGIRSTAHFVHPKGTNIHSLSGWNDTLLTTSTQGLVSLWNARSPWQPPSAFTLPSSTRAWSSLLTPSSAYLGLSDRIAVHAATSSSFSSTPIRSLTGPDLPSTSSAYAIRQPPPTSIHNPSILLSAWYDSHLRIHDLRSPSAFPVQIFFDPWTWADGSAMYSCAFLAEYHLAGGGARHGTVSLFDTRYPKAGWSCFSPGGKGSPVYALEGDGGRLWGVTDKRAFVLAFDGSAEREEGLVEKEARASRVKVMERPNGWKGRGGKWGWTVRYPTQQKGRYGDAGRGEVQGEGEVAVGYDHNDRGGVSLFDSLVAP